MALVSYTLDTLPKVSEEDWARLAAMTDADIDLSDIPLQDMSKFRPWRELHSKESIAAREKLIEDFQKKEGGKPVPLEPSMFKPVKVTVTCKLDADVVAWLKSGGKGYQTRLNAILRRVMVNMSTSKRQAAAQSR